MNFRDGLTADLPAPRDDEPESLRDDILDELADHLACAYRRELLRGADAVTARQRVLERFGDPAALARRLWFDAMRGRIMSQRILVVFCVLMAIISLSLVMMMWHQGEVSRSLVAAELAQSEAAQRELIQKLDELSRSAVASRSSDWIPVKFKLTEETPEGPPAVDVQARLGQGDRGLAKDSAIQRTSDDEGTIDFGVVHPGNHEFSLGCGPYFLTGTIAVTPGMTDKNIVCPKRTPVLVPFSLNVEWPPDLAANELAIVASLAYRGTRYQKGLMWSGSNFNSTFPLDFFCSLAPSNAITVEGYKNYWKLQMANGLPQTKPPDWKNMGFKEGQVYLDMRWVVPSEPAKTLRTAEGTYQLMNLIVVRPRKDLVGELQGERCEPIATTTNPGGSLNILIEPPKPDKPWRKAPLPNQDVASQLAVVHSNPYGNEPIKFEAKKISPTTGRSTYLMS